MLDYPMIHGDVEKIAGVGHGIEAFVEFDESAHGGDDVHQSDGFDYVDVQCSLGCVVMAWRCHFGPFWGYLYLSMEVDSPCYFLYL